MLEVIPNETEIKFKESGVIGRTSAIKIQGADRVTYEVIHWSGDRKVIWVDAFEIEPINQDKTKIGFINKEDN